MCLYSGSKDVLKVYGWEPIECYDTVPVAWGDVCDMSISNTQLVSRLNWYIVVTPYEWNPTAPPPTHPQKKEEEKKEKDSGWSQKQRFISMVFLQGGLLLGVPPGWVMQHISDLWCWFVVVFIACSLKHSLISVVNFVSGNSCLFGGIELLGYVTDCCRKWVKCVQQLSDAREE